MEISFRHFALKIINGWQTVDDIQQTPSTEI